MFNSYATWYQTQMANKQANKRCFNYPFAQIRHHLHILPIVSLRSQLFRQYLQYQSVWIKQNGTGPHKNTNKNNKPFLLAWLQREPKPKTGGSNVMKIQNLGEKKKKKTRPKLDGI